MRSNIFVGATCLEWYVGPLWGRVLLPRFWDRGFRYVTFGWDHK